MTEHTRITDEELLNYEKLLYARPGENRRRDARFLADGPEAMARLIAEVRKLRDDDFVFQANMDGEETHVCESCGERRLRRDLIVIGRDEGCPLWGCKEHDWGQEVNSGE